MKLSVVFVLVLIVSAGCNTNENKSSTNIDTTVNDSQSLTVDTSSQVYTNDRFRDVTVERLGGSKFRIRGTAQIFEASFSWVIEDGHNEIAKGHEMTDAGAPEWGHFDFTIDAVKQRENSTLHLILFESSAEDGSRQHELAMPL